MPASMLDRDHLDALAEGAKARTRPHRGASLNCPPPTVRPACPDCPPRGHSWS